MNKKILVSAFLCFFVFSSGMSTKEETKSVQKLNIKDLDATQIKLEDVKLLDSYSKFPRWSPDGSKILYTKHGSQIWMVNPDGSNKERIIDGYDAAWSPDGKRIAYKKKEVDKRKIAIFDLVEKKEYIIYEDKQGFRDRLFFLSHAYGHDYFRTQWTKDGKKLFFFDDEDIRLLNLDDLSWKKGALYGYTMANGMVETEIGRLVSSNAKKAPTHPRFIIIDRGAIYAKNKEGEIPFEICLLGGPFRSPILSPDLTKVVFSKPKWKEPLSWDLYVDAMFKGKKPMEKPESILIAKLGKSPTSHIKYYEIPLGLKNGIKRGDKLGIYVPKINPLNNKIIGYLGRKGTVLVESVTENKALARTYIIRKDFGQSDIAVKGTSFGYIKEISIEEKTKEVEVIPKIIGKLKEGLYIKKKEVFPQKVMIKGPVSIIEDIEKVKTSPIEISSWEKSDEVERDIILPDKYVKFASLQTKAKIRITIVVPLRFYLEQAKKSILMGLADLTSVSGFDSTSRLISDAIDYLKSGIEVVDDELKITLKDYTIQLEPLKGIKKNYSLAGEKKLREIVQGIQKLIEEIKAGGVDKEASPVKHSERRVEARFCLLPNVCRS